VALDRVAATHGLDDRPVLVVGAGAMGALAVRALRARRVPAWVANRTPERAQRLVAMGQGRTVPLDPGAAVGEVGGVIVAIAAPWVPGQAAAAAIHRLPWVVDLSSPSALPPGLAADLGDRLLPIDALMIEAPGTPRDWLQERLEGLVGRTLEELRAWAAAAEERDAARDLAGMASAARSAELHALWREMDGLGPAERAAIERMAERLTQRLLRDPLERLGEDQDGRYRRAAQELFRL
jgi:glutamyl-tRNA reductase